jgi:hypothetical protein
MMTVATNAMIRTGTRAPANTEVCLDPVESDSAVNVEEVGVPGDVMVVTGVR